MIRLFDFSRVSLFLFFVLGFTWITTEGAQQITWSSLLLANAYSFALISFVCWFDWLGHHFSLRSLNVFILGSLIGYLFSLTFIYAIDQLSSWTPILAESSRRLSLIKFALLMIGIYLGISFVKRASDEIYISIPLVRFRSQDSKKKDLLTDKQVLADPRLLDFAGSGLLDHRLVIPVHLIQELRKSLNHQEPSVRQNARKCLEMIKNLELLPRLNLRFHETAANSGKIPPLQKLMKIARAIDADILISSNKQRQSLSLVEEVRFINLHALFSCAPLLVGQKIVLEMQQIGKHRSQGVGFLEDGSMVVVKGAGAFIGKRVLCSLLSIKRSLTGRLLFALFLKEEPSYSLEEQIDSLEETPV